MPPASPTAGDVTRLLREWKEKGSADAEAALFALVERELTAVGHAMLRQHPSRVTKVDPRELVHEAYLALRTYPIVTVNRAPFFRLMATAMRHYLLDLVDREQAAKRPPTSLRVSTTRAAKVVTADDGVPVLDWYRAIDALRRVDGRQADVVELRIAGLNNDEIADELQLSLATVKRDLRHARAFLAFQLGMAGFSLG